MLLHAILTIVSLILFFAGFFMIGIGTGSSSEERKGLLSLVGFILVLINTIYLGSIVISQTLTV